MTWKNHLKRPLQRMICAAFARRSTSLSLDAAFPILPELPGFTAHRFIVLSVLKNGPRLDRMVKVLRVLGFRLVVQADGSQFRARETTRILTAAFRSGDLHIVSDAFAKILNAQENVSELAQKTIRTRETLYRAFTHPRIPRFSTVLTLVKALGLQLGVEPLPPKI